MTDSYKGYRVRQRIDASEDFDPDFVAEWLEEHTELRLVFDLASGQYHLVDTREQPRNTTNTTGVDHQRVVQPDLFKPGDEDGILDSSVSSGTGWEDIPEDERPRGRGLQSHPADVATGGEASDES